MRTVFVRGVFGLCKGCGAELRLRHDVTQMVVFGKGFQYSTRCGSCAREDDRIVTADVHRAGVTYMQQVGADMAATDKIVTPIGPDEEVLAKWVKILEETDDTQLLELITGEPGSG